ncbi:DUF7344 domain-containing protein [Halomontanus rarus]|uniref:DUF7344 domain-containing protein n=1 Tax=Halomontanus rarus TaxID=3034020 RepID=UPI0023E8663A|nr:hypothetical protein [Halovivax sp. TS33]
MIQNDHTPSLWDVPDIHPSTVVESPELVAVERRRRLLTHLQHESKSDSSESTTVDELVDALSADGTTVESSNADADHGEGTAGNRATAGTADRSTLRIYFHHVDLPMLEKAGLIEYDAELQRVEIVR